MTSSATLLVLLCSLRPSPDIDPEVDVAGCISSSSISSLNAAELSASSPSVSLSSVASPPAPAFCNPACVCRIDDSAAFLELRGVNATSVTTYIGFPCICATCSRRVMEIKKEYFETVKRPTLTHISTALLCDPSLKQEEQNKGTPDQVKTWYCFVCWGVFIGWIKAPNCGHVPTIPNASKPFPAL